MVAEETLLGVLSTAADVADRLKKNKTTKVVLSRQCQRKRGI